MTSTRSHAAPEATTTIEQRILDAAFACFERFGVGKTTMDDVARTAKVSRQSVYRHFAGKDDLLDAVCCREAVSINQVVRKRVGKADDFASLVSEALFVIITEGNRNPYLRQIVGSPTLQAVVTNPRSRAYQLNVSYWHELMERAREAGHLAEDITLDEIVGWLLMMQSVLQVRLAEGGLGEPDLRRLISRFTVAPLLQRPSGG
ncbi:TetR/AcrR family transcriptional regulator [Novosphingobium sp. ERN07]|uniref:TetR/AcrR family transcriptional regulator n=1 Tax=Novosphingobium sp. ERN07 TaxID=2726187 RepID=UPI0014569E46|nr:TetR/AcrR family transcriptional regulator [Novosphingobium sp. ERN07]NLR72975.1 TetR/AcrR family transcriptional regulator [Novosphingobium sp. ERN07]